MIPAIAAALAGMGGLAALLARGRPRAAALGGIVGMAAVVAAVVLAPLEPPVTVGEAALVDGRAIRLWLSAAAGSLLVTTFVSLLVAPEPGAPLLACLVIAGSAVALALDEPAAAVTAAAAVLLLAQAGTGGAWAGAFRQSALVPGLVVLAVATGTLVAADSQAAWLPAVLITVAIVVASGILPFHAASLRAARTTSTATIPLTTVWAPYLLGLIAASWVLSDPSGSVLASPEARGVLTTLAGLTIGLAVAAMFVQDDLGSLLGTHAIADAALVLLALAAGTAALPALLIWLLVAALARTAVAAWAGAAAARMGSRRMGEMRGWVRRAPLLLPALLVPIVAGVGWPGSLGFEARWHIIDGALPTDLAMLVAGASIAVALGYARLLWVGVQAPDDATGSAVPGRRRTARWAAAGLVLAAGTIPLVVGAGLDLGGFVGPAAATEWRPFGAP